MKSFLKRLLGGKASLPPAEPPRDVAALLEPLSVPAVHVVKSSSRSRSHLGGRPNLPPGIPWPERKGKRLGFMSRLSLAEIQQAQVIDWLPATGALLFFYDLEEQPWGFDPADRGGAVVLYVDDLGEPPSIEGGAAPSISTVVPHQYVTFRSIRSCPSQRDEIDALKLSDEESDAVYEHLDAEFQGQPKHQVSGFPSPVQGDDMELECQLVTHGLYCGSSSGYEDARAASLRDGAKDWNLLFQFDSDDDLDVMWGDAGTLYYWIERHRARQGDFSNAWLILQCS
jgi:uncharacterized protein YwqG